MNVGDLVRYQMISEVCPELGIVVEQSDPVGRPHGDELLVMWSSGKRWWCEGRWLEHLSSARCKNHWLVV
jgi:hypothetical protein